MRRADFVLHVLASLLAGCGGWGGGTKWVEQPLVDEEKPSTPGALAGELPADAPPPGSGARSGSRTLGAPATRNANGANGGDRTGGGGRPLGTFRNTYYDFPREADHATPASGSSGKAAASVAVMNASCQPIAQVPRGFFEALCVQGSGALKRGGTVSFAKRDCACAEVCPRTGQRICFEALDAATFPWGRGALGKPITPMRTLAADTAVLPMGTVVYIPELDGAPRGDTGEAHDGCFVVEDRGLKVTGEHVDIFTGHPAQTAVLNAHLPSNQGVTVVVDAPRCKNL
jgi:3D (Asp-Asp-Asp) domain-containing protein